MGEVSSSHVSSAASSLITSQINPFCINTRKAQPAVCNNLVPEVCSVIVPGVVSLLSGVTGVSVGNTATVHADRYTHDDLCYTHVAQSDAVAGFDPLPSI